jgi:hypothetical protein
MVSWRVQHVRAWVAAVKHARWRLMACTATSSTYFWFFSQLAGVLLPMRLPRVDLGLASQVDGSAHARARVPLRATGTSRIRFVRLVF